MRIVDGGGDTLLSTNDFQNYIELSRRENLEIVIPASISGLNVIPIQITISDDGKAIITAPAGLIESINGRPIDKPEP